MPEQRIYFPEIDSLRFIAFLAVFFHHFKTVDYFPFLKAHGWIGVELFLLISAFLITTLLSGEYQSRGKVNVKHYFYRRILRIWPLYFVYLFGMAGLTVFYGTSDSLRWGSLLTFTDNVASAFLGYNPIPFTGHLWTISLEEQLYIIFPLVVPFLVRLSGRTTIQYLVVCWLTLVVMRYLALLYIGPSHLFIWVLPIHCDSVIAGVFLAKVHSAKSGWQSPLLFLIFCLLCLAFTSWLVGDKIEGTEHVYVYTLVAIACFFLAKSGLCSQSNQFFAAVFRQKQLIYLGKISYGLYIFHIFCINLVQWAGRSWMLDENLQFIIALFLCISISALSYEVLERPILKVKNTFSGIPNKNY